MPLFGLAGVGIAAMFFVAVLVAYGRRAGAGLVMLIWAGTVAVNLL